MRFSLTNTKEGDGTLIMGSFTLNTKAIYILLENEISLKC